MVRVSPFLTSLALLGLVGMGACNAAGLGTTVAFAAALLAANEVPSNSSTGSGTLEASLDKDSRVLSYTIRYSGLSGPVQAAHFHGPASAGKNAGPALPLAGSLLSPIMGRATLSATQAADLQAGKWYINLHTSAHPDGEVRGQLLMR